jgi:hypothetical protein
MSTFASRRIKRKRNKRRKIRRNIFRSTTTKLHSITIDWLKRNGKSIVGIRQ